MLKLKRFIERALSFSSAHLWVIGLLGMAALAASFNLVFFDAAVSGLYVGTNGALDLAFNFLMGAVFLVFCGYLALKIDRHFGGGFVVFLISAAVIQMALLIAYLCQIRFAADILFFIKWGYRLIIFTGFWAYVFRYIELNLKSKRFLFLIVCEFVGFLVSGLLAYSLIEALGVSVFLVLSIMSLVAMVAILWKVTDFEKTMPELQLKKNGGVSEKTQMKLVHLIYTTAFLFTAIAGFIDYTVCLEAVRIAPFDVDTDVKFFALIWTIYGASALFLLTVLYTLRRSLHIITAMILLAFVPWLGYLGWAAQLVWVVVFTKVMFELITYFCVGYYFRMMPRPLSHGTQGRLKGSRWIIAEPIGFAFTALVFFFLPYQVSGLLYGCVLSFAFLLVLFDSQQEYASVLLSAFKTFRWRGGRLIIRNPKVLAFIEKKAESKNPQEAIYFLRVLEEAQVSNLKNHLRHALNHPSPDVRCFALGSIERNDLRMFKKTLSDLMDKDEANKVRQKALDVFCSLGEKYSVEKAILYLDDPVLRKGALIGLLKNGGEGILIASEGLNKLASSKLASRRLEAAQILQETGLKGFFRLVKKLMADEDADVQRAGLLAAGRTAHPALLKPIFRALNRMDLRDEALTALKMFGASAYPYIEQALGDDERTELCQKTLISYLWIAEDVESKKVLLRALKNMPFKLRVYSLFFLKKTPLRLSKSFVKKIFVPLIELDFKQALTTLLLIKDFRFSPTHDAQSSFEMLCDSLQRDFENIRQSLLLEIYFYFPSPLMKDAVNILLSGDSSLQERQMAESTLDDLLPKSFARLGLIIKDLPFEERLERIPSRRLKKEQTMSEQFEFILKSKSYRSVWTKACALVCVRKMDDVALVPQIEGLLDDKNPLIRESAMWALERLISNPKELKKAIGPRLKDENPAIRQMAAHILK